MTACRCSWNNYDRHCPFIFHKTLAIRAALDEARRVPGDDKPFICPPFVPDALAVTR